MFASSWISLLLSNRRLWWRLLHVLALLLLLLMLLLPVLLLLLLLPLLPLSRMVGAAKKSKVGVLGVAILGVMHLARAGGGGDVVGAAGAIEVSAFAPSKSKLRPEVGALGPGDMNSKRLFCLEGVVESASVQLLTRKPPKASTTFHASRIETSSAEPEGRSFSCHFSHFSAFCTASCTNSLLDAAHVTVQGPRGLRGCTGSATMGRKGRRLC